MKKSLRSNLKKKGNSKIWYANKYIIKQMLLTFRKNKLEVLGTYNCIIKEKAIIKPYKHDGIHYILYLEVIDEKYNGMLSVKKDEYNKARIGNYFGKCTIVKPFNKEEYYFVNEENVEKALSKISFKSKMKLLFLTLIVLLFCLSIFFLFIQFLTGF